MSVFRQNNPSEDPLAHQAFVALSYRNNEADQRGTKGSSSYPPNVLVYLNHARQTQGLLPFQTIAYPDLIGAIGAPYVESYGVSPKRAHLGKSRQALHPVVQSELADIPETKPVAPNAVIEHKTTTYLDGRLLLSADRQQLRFSIFLFMVTV